jgi:hypothetical protein
MYETADSLKTFCRRVARAAASDDGAQAIRLLQLTGLMGRVDGLGAAPRDAAENPETSGSVGIWDRKEEGGRAYFARRVEDIEDWNYWANVGRIEATTEKRRVVYLGESVARGFLYDPQYTPAGVLGKMLGSRLGEGEVEVVDLARTNLALEIRELALEALQLDPDVGIVFAGNNWTIPFPLRAEELAPLDSALRTEGLLGAQRYIEERLGLNVERVVRDISQRYRERGVPLIWICPEFNLDDWRDPEANAPQLASAANREWLHLRLDAEAALADGDLERAEELAQRMIEIDGGLTNTALYILADCRRHAGDREGERRYLETARDALPWVPSRSTSPRTQAVSRRTLHRVAGELGDVVLDVPDLFHDYLEGALPGRRLFIDYCHMTSEGILVTMAAAASSVLGALGEEAPPWRELLDHDLGPEPRVEAEASFLAAIHNGHWWQSYDLVKHYCHRAVEQWPDIREVMSRFVDLQTRRTPMLMCRAAQELTEVGSPLIQHYLLRYNNQQLDRLLIDAVVDALDAAGVDARPTLGCLRRGEHSIAQRPTDLLSYYYNSAALQPQEVRWALPRQASLPRPENRYYKAYWIESRFVFVGEEGLPARLQLTCRLPAHSPPGATVSLELNGSEQARFEVVHGWRSWDVAIDGSAVTDGLNEITLGWPVPDFPGEEELGTVVEDLVSGVYPEFYSSFGEIHSFTIDGRGAVGRAS